MTGTVQKKNLATDYDSTKKKKYLNTELARDQESTHELRTPLLLSP